MFDRLEVISKRYHQISELMTDMSVISDIKKLTALSKEQKSLESISEELNISQAQAAERLFEISALVKRICDNEVSQV